MNNDKTPHLLVISKLEKRFGGVRAVFDCDFKVKE